ncbi:MAG: hypothetical protein HY549_05565 [Elusimicrobia bacterium]|nr:hypothetical protein [Elusimicrobiota bacterium]
MEKIRPLPAPSNPDRFTVPFAYFGTTGTADFERTDLSYWVSVKRPGVKVPCGIQEGELMGKISELSAVSLERGGHERIFTVSHGLGSGAAQTYLSLIDPRTCQVLVMTLHFSMQSTEGPKSSRSRALDTAQFRLEREFLERVKGRYGFVRPVEVERRSSEDPRLAYQAWKKDNGAAQNGRLKLRRYRGQHQSAATVVAKLSEESMTYTAYFKAGVVAYDRARNEHFVVFHPDNHYHWPTALKKTGDVLLIGTRGEGLVAVNLKSWRIKRFRLGVDDGVRELELWGNAVRVNRKPLLKLSELP